MRKKLALAGMIVNTVLLTIYFIARVYTLFIAYLFTGIVSSVAENPGAMEILTFTLMFVVLIALVSLILNIASFSGTRSPEKMKAKKGLIVTNIVFTMLDVILLIIVCILTGFNTFSVVFAVGFIVGTILIIVDVAKNGKSLASTADMNFYEPVENQIQEETTEAVKTNVDTLANKIKKLEQKRDEGIITEEEFKQLKKIIVEKELND